MSEEHVKEPAPQVDAVIKPEPRVYTEEYVEKLMKEKKNWSEKAKILEAKEADREQEILKAKDDQRGINELLLKENETLKVRLTEREKDEERKIILTQVKREWEKLGLRDNVQADKLLKLVDLNKIKYDSDLKIVLGQEEEAKRIFEDFKQLFSGDIPRTSHDAPKGAPANVDMESYKKMIADGSYRKLSKADQKELDSKLWSSMGVKRT